MIPGQTGFTYVTRDHELFDILVTCLPKPTQNQNVGRWNVAEVLFEIAKKT